MAVALRFLGFKVTISKDKTLPEMADDIDAFVASLRPGDVAFAYFSGHGLGDNNENYFLPTEFAGQAGQPIYNRAVGMFALRQRIMDTGVRNTFMVADACRNRPKGKTKGEPDRYKLVPSSKNPAGTITAYATDYGRTATYLSRNNRNSLYTESLLLYLRQHLEVKDIFNKTQTCTYEESIRLELDEIQMPHYTQGIYGDFYFLKQRNIPPPPPPPYIEKPTTRKYLDLPFAEMVRVEGGTFQMGSTEGSNDEKPVHSVTVSSFYMGKYEVTQQQWESIMGSNPSYFRDCSDCPVENVSWENIQVFLQKLNARNDGLIYSLPTEAEWEYAAGGGNTTNRTRFGNGKQILDPAEANFDGSKAYKDNYSVAGAYRQKPVSVNSFAPNPLGLYNMSGNVWEWCNDWYATYNKQPQTNPTGPSTGTYRVLRGGSWYFGPQCCRTADRLGNSPSYRDVGFRVRSQIQ